MSIVAAVITGASEECAPVIHAFAYGLLREGDDFSYIRYPGAELALTRSNQVMDPMEQFVIRDILRTKAMETWRNGVRACIVVAGFWCDPRVRDLEDYVRVARRECDEIMRWNLFQDCMLACMTSRQEVIPIA